MSDIALVRRMREENDELAERILQLEEILYGKCETYQHDYGLTMGEAVVFSVIVSRDLAPREAILSAIQHRFGKDPHHKIIDVHMSRLRRKLARFGIEVKTIRGVGFMLDRHVRHQIRAHTEQAA